MTETWLGFEHGSLGRTTRRFVLRTAVWLLIVGGVGIGITAAKLYWDGTYGGWWVGLATAGVGIAAAFGSWFAAALLSLAIEAADSLRSIARGS